MKDVLGKIQEAVKFVKQDVWRIRRSQLSPGKSISLKLLRVLLLTIKGFDEDKCQLRTSALTFYSLVSIVPVAAMAFGIAKGFGFEKMLETQLRNKLAGQEEVLERIIEFSHSLLANTKGGLIAGVGLIVLLWAVVKVLGQIECSFNDIWKVREQRTIGRMFSDYLSLMLVCPVILILSGGVNVFITTQVNLIVEKFTILGSFSSFIFFLLKLLPYTLMWILFTFIYIFMPNAKVRFSSGLFAGIITGTVFQIVQWVYITFQIGAVKYNAIYGSFAVLPLFLAWLQLSWLIVLYGAEMSFAWQNADTFEFESDSLRASHRLKILFSLQITIYLIKSFICGEMPVTAAAISDKFGIPVRWVREILARLVGSGIVSVVKIKGSEENGYQPAIDVHALTIRYVVEAIEKSGINAMSFTDAPELAALSVSLEKFDGYLAALPENKLLKDM